MAVTEAMVSAALAVLREEFELGGSAQVRDYLADGMQPDERAAAIAALRAADEDIERGVRDVVRRALEAAEAAASPEETQQP